MKTSLHITFCIGTSLILFLFSAGIFAQGNTWNKSPENPIISSTPWSSHLFYPAVLFENGLYKMWFCSEIIPFASVGYAESENGIDWTVDEVPVIPGTVGGSWQLCKGPGTVLRINDTLKMWYSGSSDGFNVDLAIGYAYYDENSMEWIVHPDPVLDGDPGTWDAEGAVQPVVYHDGSTYHIWYHGFENPSVFAPCGIGYAHSTDGINWTKEGDSPVIPTGPSGSFYSTWIIPNSALYMMNQTRENEFMMWFSGWDGESPFTMKIGYATSPNGIDWTVQNNNQCVLDLGLPGSWESTQVRMAGVLHHNDTLRMWYTGMESGMLSGKIGYAWCEHPVVGIPEEHKAVYTSTIYPNPAGDQFSIITDQDIKVTLLEIIDLQGKVILHRETVDNSVSMNVSDFPKGLYLARLYTNKGVEVQKLIIQ